MATQASYSLTELVRYFLRLGTLGFGGPPALVSAMHRDLVAERGWIAENDYREGLALAQLAPGPLAAQLAIYLGYVHYGVWGATLTGIAFVLPSFLMVLALGWAYVQFEGLPWMQALFYGIGAAVIGIIAVGTYKLTRKTVQSDDWLGWTLFGISALATAIMETELLWLVLLSGGVYWLVKSPPQLIRFNAGNSLAPFLGQMLALPADSTLWQLALFFTKAGAFVFGSGLAIVPFLYGGVVKEYGWLTEQQFLDAVAVAMITPGPVVITVAFIGYLVAGFPGACVAALATFLPCYVLTVLPAPYFKRWGKHPGVKAFVDGITMAAVGAIAGAVVVLARRQLTDWPAIILALTTVGLLYRFKKLPELTVIGGAAIIGLLLRYVG
ncbi:chromate transporter, chromate ion transporter (CHR) family [Fibrisoma limi BUZ 3]|uniref:Chromate transporter, chromate ion transporter (CHR) family n=1 Tax=Fibrisoma limi BUZ 3 TaxID=1185876 RepID=I2GEW0_9BACT|nr:chromate transporter [Fibrisoma limi]CCH52435.1 chromate transporter, chromate ion transporter (CHR) family [Fibrisoma limi BUZ 3]